MATISAAYPVVYEADMPERLSRWLWLFKCLLIIPHGVVLWLLGIVFLVVVFVAWVAVIVTGKLPRGMFDFMLGFSRWAYRASAYMWLMTDKYPPFSTSEEAGYPVRLKVAYPEKSSRLTALFRWLLAIPHLIIVCALSYVMWALLLVQVVVVVFTGKPNREIFRLNTGIARWSARATMYSYLMTEQYPPFSFD